MKKSIVCAISSALASIFTFGICVCACAAKREAPFTPRENAEITIFTTNDMHGSLIDDGEKVIGIVRAAEIKASTPDSVLVDAGDATQGASFASISRGADVISAMNAAGYDLMAAGNHEFDYGADVLGDNADRADFPILAANVKKDGLPFLQSSVVIERADYKIGFIGLTTVSTATSTNPTLLQGITFEDEITAAKSEMAAIKDDADAIVLVCHMGDNSAAVSCTSEQLIKSLSDDEKSKIAAVIDGHSHTVEKTSVDGVPIVQTGVNFANLGKITINFNESGEGVNFEAHGDVLNYTEAANYTITEEGEAKGEEVSAVVSAITERQNEVLNEQLCELKSPLWGGYICYDYVESRAVETAYGDFVTDAFKYYAGQFAANEELDFPVIAVENGGGISQSLPTWHYNGTKVTRGDVLNAFNHGNMVEVLKVSPSELYAAIEKGLATTGQDETTGRLIINRVSGSFIQCSGFSYTYDPAGGDGSRVTEVKLDNGDVLDRADTENKLLLATNNYVSASFAQGEKLGELGGEDIIVEDYILFVSQQNGGVLEYNCDYDRIKIANDKSPQTYEVRLSVGEGGSPVANRSVNLFIDGGEAIQLTTDGEGYITVTLDKGAHTLFLEGFSDFVYVNNYSGTSTFNKTEGYYQFGFIK